MYIRWSLLIIFKGKLLVTYLKNLKYLFIFFSLKDYYFYKKRKHLKFTLLFLITLSLYLNYLAYFNPNNFLIFISNIKLYIIFIIILSITLIFLFFL